MASSKLQLNDGNTEMVVLATAHQHKQMDTVPVIRIGDDAIQSSAAVRNLGAMFDCHMHMEKHVNNVCRSCYYHLRNIGRMRKYLTKAATE